MKTREEIQSDVACMSADPREVQATVTEKLLVYPPTVGLNMALRALGNTLAVSLENPEAAEHVTQQDTLIFYWAVTTDPRRARQMLTTARETGDLKPILAEAEELSWLLTPVVIADLNAAIARTREQVQAVTVAVIPDPKTPQDSKN